MSSSWLQYSWTSWLYKMIPDIYVLASHGLTFMWVANVLSSDSAFKYRGLFKTLWKEDYITLLRLMGCNHSLSPKNKS